MIEKLLKNTKIYNIILNGGDDDMVIAGFLCALFGLVLFFIPVLAPILALVGLILSIVALRKRKDEKNKGISIAGIVIAAIAIVVSIVYTIVLLSGIMLLTSMGTDVINNDISTAIIQNDFSEIQSEVTLAIAQEMALDENATTKDIVKEKIALREERNIVYDKASFEILPETTKIALKDKVAIKDSGKTYYKIDEMAVSSIVDTDVFVIDEDGKVYVNTVLQHTEI